MSICARCTLRLQRAAQADTLPASRAFSTTAQQKRQHGIPTFTPTPSSPDLSNLLSTFRTHHLVPAALRPAERRLIFATKNRQLLLDNPRSTQIGNEEVPLQWIDRQREIPNRTKLFNEAIEMMCAGSGEAWRNLAPLLMGMRDCKARLSEHTLAKVVRKAGLKGRMGTIIVCLQQVESTGLSLKIEAVMKEVLIGIREHAARAEWSEEAVTKARKWAVEVAGLLERTEHGGGKTVGGSQDARRRPEVLGMFLELAAVDAVKHKGGKDVEGSVKMYTERLLSCLPDDFQPPSITPAPLGPQLEMLHGVPIFHGLSLAEKILGSSLPQVEKVGKVKDDYEAGLTVLAQALEVRGDGAGGKEGTYGGQALKCWGSVIRD